MVEATIGSLHFNAPDDPDPISEDGIIDDRERTQRRHDDSEIQLSDDSDIQMVDR